MKEQWNFHNYVAIPLENYSRKYIGNNHTTADDIDTGEFVDACQNYGKLPHSKIPDSVAQELFADFERLVRTK